MAKSSRPILVLSLLAEWHRALSSPDFTQRKARCLWVYHAMTNVGIAWTLFGGTLPHQNQNVMWRRFDIQKRKQVPQLLRTGTVTQSLVGAFNGVTAWEAMQFDLDRNGILDPFDEIVDEEQLAWNAVYGLLVRIAATYSPDGQSPVFYPFHILSCPRAQAFSWDWGILARLATRLLQTLTTSCNRNAEADFAEPGRTPTVVIYWICHFICDKIRSLKDAMPGADREVIAFPEFTLILDRDSAS
ncbi:hypothetical protein FDECE_10278 [Fusarium decemcellulare]|nr:hypothetical protein FDECE_10278 [Fusarium decemcellulare]